VRTHVQEQEREERPERPGAATAPPLVSHLLDLQRTLGNAGVGRILSRQETATAEPAAAYESWTDREVRAIQRELRRLRLYDLSIDGDLGRMTDQGLVEAFGGDSWRTMTAADALARLQAATRPAQGRGHDFRYGELFKDGLLDITFGIGYMEEDGGTYMAELEEELATALEGRGFGEDPDRADELLNESGRASSGTGRLFVLENAMTYSPPAGDPTPIHIVVRLVSNAGGDRGAQALDAFREGMTQGDVAYYTGHGRYGSGPDFDRNFAQFTLLDADGNVTQTLDDYTVLEHELQRESRDPWRRFLQRVQNDTLRVDLSNAGNLRLTDRNRHGEFGAKLIYWAMEQSGTEAETGRGGRLATEAAAHPDRRYRVNVFDGCRTQDYERSIRSTPGFDTHSADIIETRRTVGFYAEAETFMSFLEGIIGQQSAEEVVRGMNQEMREHEDGGGNTESAPFVGTGLGGNPRR
jgi:hypothetical protein